MVSMVSLRPLKSLLKPIRIRAQKIPRVNAVFWNLQYRSGLWVYLDAETAGSELVKILQKHTKQPSILDLGCGKGANLPLVPGTYRHYHGVDISSEAIMRARSLGRPDTSYETADVSHYDPQGSYDVILLIEVLYYLPTETIPELLRRLSTHLTPDGVMIAQVFDGLEDRLAQEDAIYASGLVIGEEATAAIGDSPRTIYVLANNRRHGPPISLER